MNPYREPECLGNGCQGRTVLKRSEAADLTHLADLVARVFHVPFAWLSITQSPHNLNYRTGSGGEHWDYIEALPAVSDITAPAVFHDPPAGDTSIDLGFVAITPVNTLCRKRLGVLVIADSAQRPTFSSQDLQTLVDLAAVIADRIEMRMIAERAQNLHVPVLSGCPPGESLHWA